MTSSVARINDSGPANALNGQVVVSPSKALWLGGMLLVAIIGGALTFSLEVFMVFAITTSVSLCLGHSLGMHRRLIHQSYQCPMWLEYFFVHLGVIVGLAGPIGMIKTHDIRDWAQRQPQSHDYFGHQQPMLIDAYWQLFCDIKLQHPPRFDIEPRVTHDKIYNFMENTWMLQQLPIALILFAIGGLPWVIWGVCMRVSVSVLGHWLVGYYAHNGIDIGGTINNTKHCQKHFHVQGASIQGYNIPIAALLTFGESWHNNHHAYPESAKIGIGKNEIDLGWLVLLLLQSIGLVWDCKLPGDLPVRKELVEIN